MSRLARAALLVGLGALVSPVAQILAARYSGRHYLGIKEQQ